MTSSPGEPRAWRRLADALIQRRIELSPRYRNRHTFCTEKEINYRLISDIENAPRSRTNFEMATLAIIARAYEVPVESIVGFLDGTKATLNGHAPRHAAPVPASTEPEPVGGISISLETARAIVGPAVMDTATSIRRHAETVLARNSHATGEDIFPGEPDLAGLWDLAPSLSVPERSRYAAIMRLGRQQRKSG